MNVVFENVKFLRATSVSNDSRTQFSVSIQPGTGKFEVQCCNSFSKRSLNSTVVGSRKQYRRGRWYNLPFSGCKRKADIIGGSTGKA